jgi:uncharacterized protein (DUF1684 family)
MLLALADWRRLTAEMYAAVRKSPGGRRESAWQEFRKTRSEMFRSHAQSPLLDEQKQTFNSLRYFPYSPAWRFRANAVPIQNEGARHAVVIDLPEGKASLQPFAHVQFTPPSGSKNPVRLTLYWIQGYGGGLFLPFKDRTNGIETYGGGRYLYDTIKGADLGVDSDSILLDFNFSYNPSCAYSPLWTCPLAPAENSLPLRIEAGELAFKGQA